MRRRRIGRNGSIGAARTLAAAAVAARADTGRTLLLVVAVERRCDFGQDFVSGKVGGLALQVVLVVKGLGRVNHESVHVVPEALVMVLHPFFGLRRLALDRKLERSSSRKRLLGLRLLHHSLRLRLLSLLQLIRTRVYLGKERRTLLLLLRLDEVVVRRVVLWLNDARSTRNIRTAIQWMGVASRVHVVFGNRRDGGRVEHLSNFITAECTAVRWDAAVAAGSGRCAAAHTIAVATRLFVLGLSLLFSRHVDAKISIFAPKVRMAVRVCGGHPR